MGLLKGIRLFLCSFWIVLGFPFERIPDLSQPLASAAASSYQKPPEANTTEFYVNIYNYIYNTLPATKLGTLTHQNVPFLLVRSLFMVVALNSNML